MILTMLPSNATLRSVKSSLPEEYARLVLKQLLDCERSLGDARIRICLNLKSDPPHYRIDAVMDLETGETTNWGSFSGRTHRPLSERQSENAIWSQDAMTFRQVSELIGEIRNFKKAKRSTSHG